MCANGFHEIGEEFVSDIVTMLYNLRVLVVVEQPTSSQFFKYSAVTVTLMHYKYLTNVILFRASYCFLSSEACAHAFSWLKVVIRMGYFASPSVLLVLTLWCWIRAKKKLRKPLQLWGTHYFLMRCLRALQQEECLHDMCLVFTSNLL